MKRYECRYVDPVDHRIRMIIVRTPDGDHEAARATARRTLSLSPDWPIQVTLWHINGRVISTDLP